MLRRLFVIVLTLAFLIVVGTMAYVYWEDRQPKENAYDPMIVNITRDAGVDPFLIRALIWRESRFNPLTHGSADERGLMQIKPDVGEMWAKANKIEDFKDDDLYDPETNIRVGTWYLNRSLKRWSQTDDPTTFALAEYNAGHGNAMKWVDPLAPLNHTAFVERITFPGTRKYVEVIEEKRDQYRQIFSDSPTYKDPAAATNNVPMTKVP